MKLNKKNKLLLFGFLMVIFLCYNFAISNTIEYYKSYKFQSQIKNTTANMPQLLTNLTIKEKQIDKWLAANNYSKSSYQNELLKQLNALCNKFNLKIIDFKEPHTFKSKGTIILSYTFSLEGNFNSVLKTINKIENNPTLGKIKHINTIKKLNYKTNIDYITTEIIIERYENIN